MNEWVICNRWIVLGCIGRDRYMDGCIIGWIERWMDRWMDGWVLTSTYDASVSSI
jgi:hypothetical protein